MIAWRAHTCCSCLAWLRSSRLGCQVIVKPELAGMRVMLPSETHNLMP